MTAAFLNPAVRRDDGYRGLFTDAEHQDVRDYYGAQPEPTPLHSLDAAADALGIGGLAVKDETGRFGLNAFKITGVRYAVHSLGHDAASRGLVCATAGNHGRAVARAARDARVPCTIVVPAARPPSGAPATYALEMRTRSNRVDGMREDGATVVEVRGSYEDAVRLCREHALRTGATIVSDTSWPGYETIPRWIMAGYTQIFEEASREWRRRPDLLIVQAGVGGLVCAAASWNAARFGSERPYLISCEPDASACLLASARVGRPTTIATDGSTAMAGLRCAEPSPAAWPAIASGVDAFVTVPDDLAVEATSRLADSGAGDPPIAAGLSGACGAAALIALTRVPALAHVRAAAGMDRSTHVLIVVTEGA